jgi:hypothetical protein
MTIKLLPASLNVRFEFGLTIAGEIDYNSVMIGLIICLAI